MDGLVALSPISAIPAAFLLTLGLAVASVVHGIFVGESIEFGQLVQGTITGSFIVILLALDVIFETFLVSLPVLGAAGYAGAGYAARSATDAASLAPHWQSARCIPSPSCLPKRSVRA